MRRFYPESGSSTEGEGAGPVGLCMQAEPVTILSSTRLYQMKQEA